jgi:hypothetical protein
VTSRRSIEAEHPPFPPDGVGAPADLARVMRQRMGSIELPPAVVGKLVEDASTQRAEDDVVIRELAERLATIANRALADSGGGSRARWRPYVRPAKAGGPDLRWFLVDDDGARALAECGYQPLAARMSPSWVTIPLALAVWVALFFAYRTRTLTAMIAALVAWAAWFGARIYFRRRDRAR